MKIGVLALQGAFIEHVHMLEGLGVQAPQVRLPEDLAGLDGLVIPGGESTTIGKLAVDFGLLQPLQEFGAEHAVWGTCAGAIFLSRDIHRSQPLLHLMDITVSRNAFGRQVDSFSIELEMPCLDHLPGGPAPYHAIFIRAPLIESVRNDATIIAELPDGGIVAARQRKLLATSFHPELSGDDRLHRYFLEMV